MTKFIRISKLSQKILILALVLMLNACSNSNNYVVIDEYYAKESLVRNAKINYLPNINIISNDDAITDIINRSDNLKFKVTSADVSVLTLHIESTLKIDPFSKQSLNLVGIVKKKTQKYNYSVNYKILDSLGNVVNSGETLGLSNEPITTLSKTSVIATKSSIQDATEQLIEQVNNNLKDILIDFKVISISKDSVFVAINKEIELTNQDIFLVNELPQTALTLKNVTRLKKHSIAELKVIAGEFPSIGMTVNLQK